MNAVATSLIACRDCGTQISLRATACPKCGAPGPVSLPPLINSPIRPKDPVAVGSYVCTTCGKTGSPASMIRGNMIIEIILWCFFLIPGLIYSIWRASSRYFACGSCGGKMIQSTSPQGQAILQKLYGQTVIVPSRGPSFWSRYAWLLIVLLVVLALLILVTAGLDAGKPIP